MLPQKVLTEEERKCALSLRHLPGAREKEHVARGHRTDLDLFRHFGLSGNRAFDIEREKDMKPLPPRRARDIEESDREHGRAGRARFLRQFDPRDCFEGKTSMVARAACRDFQAPCVNRVTVLADQQDRAIGGDRHNTDGIGAFLVCVRDLTFVCNADVILAHAHEGRRHWVLGVKRSPAKSRALGFIVHVCSPFILFALPVPECITGVCHRGARVEKIGRQC